MVARKTSTPDNWLDEHGDVLYRYALKRLRNKSVAEEMVQETLLAALQSSSSFAGESSERTWLVGILKHKIVDHYRRISRQSAFDPNADLDSEHGELFRESGEWVDHWKSDLGPSEWRLSPETAVERKEFWEALTRCLENLPGRTSTAFTLRELDQFDTDEIYKVLDVSPTNLWVILHRARAHLRRCLEINWFGKVTQ